MSGNNRHKGFSLMELLVVMAIMGILAVAIVPSISAISQTGEMTKNTYDVASLLELARSHAKAHNTKVEVGFRSDKDGLSAVVVAVRAGEDFSPLSRVYRFPRVRLADVDTRPGRPEADLTFMHPPDDALKGFDFHGEKYPFIVEFNGRGDARARTDELSRIIEIGLMVNINGSTPAALEADYGVIQISGLSGGVEVYRP